jgi:hypothetical protein
MLAALMLPGLYSVQAKQEGPQEFFDWIWSEGGQPVNVWWGPQTIVADESCFVYHGFFLTSHDLGDWMPVRIRMFINDKEVKLTKYFCVDNTRNDVDDVIHCFLFYRIFEAGYFEPGVYDFRVEWSWKTDAFEVSAPITVIAG